MDITFKLLQEQVKEKLLKKDNFNFLKGRSRVSYLSKHYPKMLADIYKYTSFLPTEASLIERLVCIKEGYTSRAICICSNFLKFHKGSKKYLTFCSSKCPENIKHVQEVKKQLCLIKYGVSHHWKLEDCVEKRKKTFLHKYGSEFIGSSKSIREKIKKTNIKRYGGPAPLCSKHISKKAHETFCKKPQAELDKINNKRLATYNKNKDRYIQKIKESWQRKSPQEISEIVSKREKTCVEKFGRCNPSQVHLDIRIVKFRENKEKYKKFLDVLHNKRKLNIKQIAKILNIDASIVSNDFYRFNLKINQIYRSFGEDEVIHYLKTLGCNDIIKNYKLERRELDIFIPSLSLAIEYNGNFRHSFSIIPDINERKRHFDKTVLCRTQDIRLFHIPESDWISPVKSLIWKSILAKHITNSKSIIYARNTEIKEVSAILAKSFFDNNHLQGYVHSSVYYGLFFKDELVSVMSFLNKKNGLWELIRFSSKLHHQVIGGASKLLKYFEKLQTWKKLQTFADLKYSYGDLYKKLNFNLEKELPYDYVYTDGKEIFHKRRFQRKYLPKLLGNKFNPDLTEIENVLNSGKYRIMYDAGKLKFSKVNSND